jgi:hypothetical protein
MGDSEQRGDPSVVPLETESQEPAEKSEPHSAKVWEGDEGEEEEEVAPRTQDTSKEEENTARGEGQGSETAEESEEQAQPTTEAGPKQTQVNPLFGNRRLEGLIAKRPKAEELQQKGILLDPTVLLTTLLSPSRAASFSVSGWGPK